jgi:hypothetical protein
MLVGWGYVRGLALYSPASTGRRSVLACALSAIGESPADGVLGTTDRGPPQLSPKASTSHTTSGLAATQVTATDRHLIGALIGSLTRNHARGARLGCFWQLLT